MRMTGRDNADFIRERLSRDDPAHPDYEKRRRRDHEDDVDRSDEYREQRDEERRNYDDDLTGR